MASYDGNVFASDAYDSAVQSSVAYTTDSILKRINIFFDSVAGVFASDSYTLDAYDVGNNTVYRIDVVLKQLKKAILYTIDAGLGLTKTASTYTADVVLAQEHSKTYNADVALKRINLFYSGDPGTYDINDYATDAYDTGNNTVYALDVILQQLGRLKTYTIDTALKKLLNSQTYTIDTALILRKSATYTVDAILKLLNKATTYTVNVALLLRTLKTYTVDAGLALRQIGSTYTIDTVLNASTNLTVFGNSVIQTQPQGSAVIQTQVQGNSVVQ